MLLENLRFSFNLFLIELYAHLSAGFLLYNVANLMGHIFKDKDKGDCGS